MRQPPNHSFGFSVSVFGLRAARAPKCNFINIQQRTKTFNKATFFIAQCNFINIQQRTKTKKSNDTTTRWCNFINIQQRTKTNKGFIMIHDGVILSISNRELKRVPISTIYDLCVILSISNRELKLRNECGRRRKV